MSNFVDSSNLAVILSKIKSWAEGKFLTQHQDISGKVDKVSGKGLSTNDFTTELKNKLDGIASGAEVNVQADWNQTSASADDYIKNKPTLFSGNYNDLSNKPTIPTIPSLSKGTTNGSGNAVTDIAVSGHTVTLTKGATFLTQHQDISGKQDKITSSNKLDYSLISGTPTIPTAVSKQTVTDWGFVQIVVVAFSGGAYGGSSDTGTVSFKTFAGSITRAQFLNMITTDNAVILVDSVSGNVMASEIAYDIDTDSITVVALRDGASYKFVINSSSRYTRTITSFSSGGGSAGVDYIVEQGTTGIWHYEKWASGKLVQYAQTEYTGKLNTSQAGGYSSAKQSIANYPIAFISNPVLTYGVYCSGDSASFVAVYPSATPTTGIGNYRLWRGNSQGTSHTYNVCFEAKGRWK